MFQNSHLTSSNKNWLNKCDSLLLTGNYSTKLLVLNSSVALSAVPTDDKLE